jgi:hypothetical protein
LLAPSHPTSRLVAAPNQNRSASRSRLPDADDCLGVRRGFVSSGAAGRVRCWEPCAETCERVTSTLRLPTAGTVRPAPIARSTSPLLRWPVTLGRALPDQVPLLFQRRGRTVRHCAFRPGRLPAVASNKIGRHGAKRVGPGGPVPRLCRATPRRRDIRSHHQEADGRSPTESSIWCSATTARRPQPEPETPHRRVDLPEQHVSQPHNEYGERDEQEPRPQVVRA